MAKMKIIGWSCDPDAEFPRARINEAISDHIAEHGKPPAGTTTITVYGYARVTVDPDLLSAQSIVDDLIDELDDEYGDPYDKTGFRRLSVTPTMLHCATNLIRAVTAKYRPATCERVKSIEVDLDSLAQPQRNQT